MVGTPSEVDAVHSAPAASCAASPRDAVAGLCHSQQPQQQNYGCDPDKKFPSIVSHRIGSVQISYNVI